MRPNRNLTRILAIVVILAVATTLRVFILAPAMAAEGRIALVIGNGAYDGMAYLAKPPNDAAAIADTLRALGFEVREERNLREQVMRETLIEFVAKAQQADVVLVFYAGHGMQMDDVNYLVPVDTELNVFRNGAQGRLFLSGLPNLNQILDIVARANRLGVVILDASRDNPFADTLARSLGPNGSTKLGRGLARIGTNELPANTFVAFATRANDIAADTAGEHSPYAQALLEHLTAQGMEIRLLFGQIRETVMALTEQKQRPFYIHTISGTPFYFVPPARQESPGNPVPKPPPPEAESRQLSEWHDTAQDFLHGWSRDPNPKQAAEFFLKAATSGHAESQFELGKMYEKGYGVEKCTADTLDSVF